MLDPVAVYHQLKKLDVPFFTGVPDSLLKEFCACISDQSAEKEHVIAANEGGGVALATGHYLATGKCALVYMQNSGLGNAVNPLLSLTDADVYSVPMLLMVGWRGEPGVKDEPQHLRQGAVTESMLNVLGIPYFILPMDASEAEERISQAHMQALAESRPVALLVRKKTFESYISRERDKNERSDGAGSAVSSPSPFLRERAIEVILQCLPSDAAIVATTGKTSRELFELRERRQQKHDCDFLTVGSMGHCSQIALGLALAQPERKVVCLDGDGAMLMHMGSLAITAQSGAKNLLHVVLNNEAHESVGAQPTAATGMDLPSLAASLNYAAAASCNDEAGLLARLADFSTQSGPCLLEVKIAVGSRVDLGRPSLSPLENKQALMNFLKLD